MLRKEIKILLVVTIFLIPFIIASNVLAVTTIKIGHVDPGKWTLSKSQASSEVFQALLESGTSGEVKVEIYPASQLGGERELVEGVKIGTIEMCLTTESPVSQFFKEIMVLSTPFLFKSPPVAWAVFDGPFGTELAEAIKKATGCRVLSYGQVGFRHFSNSKRPIRNPDDMKGLKIRVMESPVYISMVRALGASATPIAFPEVYTSLQQGVVDGQENPVSTFVMNKFDEVQKYLTLDGHLYSPQLMLINERIFQNYPQKLKDVITNAAKVCATVSRGVEVTTSYLGVMEAVRRGVQVYVPTFSEQEAFKEKAQKPVIEYLQKEIGTASADLWLNKLFQGIRQAEAEVYQK